MIQSTADWNSLSGMMKYFFTVLVTLILQTLFKILERLFLGTKTRKHNKDSWKFGQMYHNEYLLGDINWSMVLV